MASAPSGYTLLTELAVDNSRGDILAGSYAQVRFEDTVAIPALTLPANALLFRSEGIRVGVVDVDGRVKVKAVTIGRDFGQSVEMTHATQLPLPSQTVPPLEVHFCSAAMGSVPQQVAVQVLARQSLAGAGRWLESRA